MSFCLVLFWHVIVPIVIMLNAILLIMNLVAHKATAKSELLFNKLASGCVSSTQGSQGKYRHCH